MKITKQTLSLWAVMLLLFLAAMNFKMKFFYFVFAAFFVYCLLSLRVTVSDKAFFYVLLAVVMAIYCLKDGLLAGIRVCAFPISYILGYNLIGEAEKSADCDGAERAAGWTKKLILAMAAGAFFHLMLNFARNYGTAAARNTIDIWSGEIMSATGQAALAVLMLSAGTAFLLYPGRKTERWFGLAVVGFIMAYNMILSGRTLVMMLFILLVSGLIFLRWQKQKISKIVLWLGGIGLIFLLAAIFNVGGLGDAIIHSNLYQRFFTADAELGLMETGRTEIKQFYLQNFYKYPFGGLNMRKKYGFSHDLLLDGYDEYGILAALPLIVILWYSVRNLWEIVKNPAGDMHMKVLLVCMYLGLYMEFCMEPVFAGMPWLFVCFCVLNGCTERLAKIWRRGDELENTANQHSISKRKHGKNCKKFAGTLS